MRRDEAGAVAVITAVTLVVLIGMGALVLDIGALFAERRIVQNGADAAALAIARDCATTGCAAFNTTAGTYADTNADDATTTIDSVCGNGAGMTACADPPAVPAGAGYVRVNTKTREADGSDEVPFGFGRIFDRDGSTVTASSTAIWGGPSSITSSLPMTISQCEYDAYTSSGTSLAPAPPYPPFPAAAESVIYLHDTTGASPCPAGPSGSDLSGGFGWLSTSSDCTATSDTDDWFADSTGRPPPTSCTAALFAAQWQNVVAIPIFDQTNGLTGANGSYHMSGFAAFYVTGYSILGQYKKASAVTNSFPCSGQASCVSGYFVDSSDLFTGIVGGASMGVTVINLFE